MDLFVSFKNKSKARLWMGIAIFGGATIWALFTTQVSDYSLPMPRRPDDHLFYARRDKENTEPSRYFDCEKTNTYIDCKVLGERANENGEMTADEFTWRRMNPAIASVDDSTLLYIERQSKLVRESRTGEAGRREMFWIKTNRLILSLLGRTENGCYFIRDLTQQNLDPFQSVVSSSNRVSPLCDCELPVDYSDGGHGYHDPRLFYFKNDLYMLFNSREKASMPNLNCSNQSHRSLYLGSVAFPNVSSGASFSINEVVRLRINENVTQEQSQRQQLKQQQIERNWSPIIFDSVLYFSYKFYPAHVLLKCDERVGTCSTAFITNSTGVFGHLRRWCNGDAPVKDISSKPHGGTPSLLLQSSKGRFYLGVFHCYVQSNRGIKTYYNFPYKVEPLPPFKIMEVATKPLPLLGTLPERFRKVSVEGPHYYRSNYRPDHNIAFVSDMVALHELQGEATTLVMSYGRNDAEARLFQIELETLERDYF